MSRVKNVVARSQRARPAPNVGDFRRLRWAEHSSGNVLRNIVHSSRIYRLPACDTSPSTTVQPTPQPLGLAWGERAFPPSWSISRPPIARQRRDVVHPQSCRSVPRRAEGHHSQWSGRGGENEGARNGRPAILLSTLVAA